jgi:nitrogenase iron protein NifH
MSIHAAANIAVAVENFRDRGYAELGGVILNRRNVKNEDEKVKELADDIHSSIVGTLDRSETVLASEALQKAVIEAFPESEMAGQYRKLAASIMHVCGKEVPC